MALGMVGRKLKTSLGGSVDLGLMGKDGVVHPSLAVRIGNDAPSASFPDGFMVFQRLRRLLFTGKCEEIGTECQLLWINCGEPAVQIWKGKKLISHFGKSSCGIFLLEYFQFLLNQILIYLRRLKGRGRFLNDE